MGSCYSSAVSARELVPEIPVEVIDSRNCYMGEGFAAIAAAEAARKAGTLKDVVRAAENITSKTQTVFYINGTEYIKKCGRLNLPQEVLDKWVKTKVLMVLKEGKLDPHQIQNDPADELLEAMDRMMGGKSGRLHVAIAHGDIDPSDLKNRIASRYSPDEILTCTLTPVAGVHTGPGIIGVNFFIE